jgi:cation/acetate symporter
VAFATILAVVAGLVIASSGAVAHDLWSNVVRRGEASEAEEVKVGRLAALGLGVMAIVISVLAGEGYNVSLLVGFAFAVAASSNLPALVFSLFWKRFNTTSAVAGVVGGLLTSLILIALIPAVWPGPDGEGSPIPLTNPAIVSIPAGILCAVLGTLLSGERASERSYHELHVRAETGLGAERRAVAH